MKHRIRKSFQFEAAHQLETAYTAQCHECIHGHSYTVELYIESDILLEDEMVLDFSKLKAFKDSIMLAWDHGLILHERKRKYIQPLIDAGVLKAEKVTFLLNNPTAEIMAVIIFNKLRVFLTTLGTKAKAKKVRVHETASGWAEVIA